MHNPLLKLFSSIANDNFCILEIMTENTSPNSDADLKKTLTEINERLKKRTSFKYIFFYSLVQGIGSVIGATLIAGVLVAIAVKILMSFSSIPIIDQLYSMYGLNESFENFNK